MPMTNEKVLSAANKCFVILRSNYVPMQIEEAGPRAAWCANQIPTLLSEGRREKAMRWLGFVQGVVFSLGLASTEDLKNMSKPDEGASDEGPDCTCDAIRAADPLRHFRGCALRKPLPVDRGSLLLDDYRAAESLNHEMIEGIDALRLAMDMPEASLMDMVIEIRRSRAADA